MLLSLGGDFYRSSEPAVLGRRVESSTAPSCPHLPFLGENRI